MYNSSFAKALMLFGPYVWHAWSARLRTSLSIGLMGLEVWAASMVPYMIKLIVDTLNGHPMPFHGIGIGVFVLGLCIFWAYEALSRHVGEIVFFPVINEAIRHITWRTVDHLHRTPLTLTEHLDMPDVISRIKRISQSARMFIRVTFFQIIPSIFKISVAVFAIHRCFEWGSLVWLTLALSLTIAFFMAKTYTAIRKEAWQRTDYTTIVLADSIHQSSMVRFNYHDEMQRVERSLNREANAWVQTNKSLHQVHVVLSVIQGIGLCFLLWFTTKGFQQGHLTMGDVMMIQGYAMGAFSKSRSLVMEGRQLWEALIDIDKIQIILNIPQTPPKVRTRPPAKALFKIESVTFERHNQPLFTPVTFTLQPGEKILITGPNGVGKSTLCKLIAGLYAPTTGMITWGGIPLHDLDLFHNNKEIIYIPQKADPCFDTVVHPEKLITLGFQGRGLSGGEAQLTLIENALIKEPRLLILDETLADMAPDLQKQVLKRLMAYPGIVILVAHHHPKDIHFDQVIALEPSDGFGINRRRRIS